MPMVDQSGQTTSDTDLRRALVTASKVGRSALVNEHLLISEPVAESLQSEFSVLELRPAGRCFGDCPGRQVSQPDGHRCPSRRAEHVHRNVAFVDLHLHSMPTAVRVVHVPIGRYGAGGL
jgi:hypothetical protein